MRFLFSFIFSLLIAIALGVFAPKASAYDFTDSQVNLIIDRCAEHSNLDIDNISFVLMSYDYGYGSSTPTSVSQVGVVFLVDKKLSLNSPNIYYSYPSLYSDFGYSPIYRYYIYYSPSIGYFIESYYIDNVSSRSFYYTTDYGHLYVFSNTGSFPSVSEYNFISFKRITGTFISSISTYHPLVTSYLLDNNFVPTGCYFANESGEPLYALNLVDDVSQLPDDFSGVYCKRTVYPTYFSFEVSYTLDSSPNDFQDFWDSYLCVQFDQVEYSYLHLYFGSLVYQRSNHLHPFIANLGTGFNSYDSNFENFTFLNSTKLFYGGSTSYTAPEGTNLDSSFIVGMRWRVYNHLSAIPWTDISPMCLGISYKHINVDTGEADEGLDSPDYHNYYESYLQNIMNTFTGTYTGSTSADLSFDDATINTDFDYINDYVLTYDSNFLYLVSECFKLDYLNGVVTGVLAISFACYIIFGKMF